MAEKMQSQTKQNEEQEQTSAEGETSCTLAMVDQLEAGANQENQGSRGG